MSLLIQPPIGAKTPSVGGKPYSVEKRHVERWCEVSCMRVSSSIDAQLSSAKMLSAAAVRVARARSSGGALGWHQSDEPPLLGPRDRAGLLHAVVSGGMERLQRLRRLVAYSVISFAWHSACVRRGGGIGGGGCGRGGGGGETRFQVPPGGRGALCPCLLDQPHATKIPQWRTLFCTTPPPSPPTRAPSFLSLWQTHAI